MNPRRRAAIACAALAVWQLGAGGYIHAKALLAQALLERAWTRQLADHAAHRPWPWADTVPVARLTVPRLAVSEIVLAGDSGRTLAFGPAWNEGSAPLGTDGPSIVSGHRDTHFAFLSALRPDDTLILETGAGRSADYRVTGTRIVDSRTTRIDAVAGGRTLLLVTCYPFDAIVPGGPLRYVVFAEPAMRPAS